MRRLPWMLSSWDILAVLTSLGTGCDIGCPDISGLLVSYRSPCNLLLIMFRASARVETVRYKAIVVVELTVEAWKLAKE